MGASLSYHISFLSPSSGDGSKLTEILSQGALKLRTPNQPTNHRQCVYYVINRPIETKGLDPCADPRFVQI